MAKRVVWGGAMAAMLAIALMAAAAAGTNPWCSIFTDPWDPMCWLLGCCL